ncbi:hypothetical protein A3D85_03010 [Candidatus Amesbacteria bacterium RIFCSPHIGHO2_02_FULL_47_9]|uniref:Uncharacterized protein n=1 Tax=Candidatus Amesbacteria bacterium RIFCSPHIGHO2_01_FULL_48_32b TaxID=1797253 RepID=A0A1F4YET8_9BACT|nr:MAG: hypothetical protein A2876_04225 [Candidatus Amesbacteria bacterium RIFCSPHIGHO2_01_FULL_48_32b]OGD05062.1 MAG: hypothetical protein A3D85_03010 [Candidatus Amesbacteria bacterium RIFCSPHIGHO2_02_FULL_47_9]OGD08604.1 MAG: hypothetical protein A2899_02495 [Candidatus Amesbacteria bacterium RIFCSPLOWO2_01_FULL_49_25]
MGMIMSYEEYLKLGRQPNPYLVWIASKGKQLYFLGSSHSFNPADSIHQVTKHYWHDFLGSVGNKKPVVLIEGGKRSISNSEDEAIRKFGEAGLVAFLAAQNGWEHESPEPNLLTETSELRKEFSEEEIWTYYFTRMAAQWNRLLNKPDIWSYVRNSLLKDNEELKWNADNLGQESLVNNFAKLSGQKFVEFDYELLNGLCDPTKTKTKINQVSRRSGQIRDEYIVQKITEHWKNGESIFAVYGRSHVVMQEPALRRLLT